jgi:ABC-2 type transport system permease protein
MLILIGMPIVQIILFGFAITTEVKNIRFTVIDNSKDEISNKLVEQLSANSYFNFLGYISNEEDIDILFKRGKADLVMVFEEGFGENFGKSVPANVQLVTDGSDPNTAMILTNYATNIINGFQLENSSGLQGAIMVPEMKMLYNPQMKSAYNFVPGVMGLILMLICAMMTSISIVREKERGTMEVLLSSPVKPFYIILAKTVPYLVLSAINIISILLLSVYILGVPVTGSLWLLSLVSLIFVFVSLSLGILISTVVKTQVAAMLASGMVLMMPVMLLSGMIFPIESMPKILQWLSAVIPARWYILAVRKVMIEGLTIGFVIKEISILLAMVTFLITVSLKKFKIRL